MQAPQAPQTSVKPHAPPWRPGLAVSLSGRRSDRSQINYKNYGPQQLLSFLVWPPRACQQGFCQLVLHFFSQSLAQHILRRPALFRLDLQKC